MGSSNNNQNEAFEALKQYLVQTQNAKIASGGREIIKRCHICGDSLNKSSAHMYIGMRDGAIVYNCFKCNAHGIVDGKFLRDMNCYDPNIALLCQEQNKTSSGSRSAYSGSFKRTAIKNLLIPFSNNEYAAKKINYINSRLGMQIGFKEIQQFKIVLNLKEFLIYNGITNFTRDESLMDLLDKFFVGFLSMDNRYVILRRLIPESKLPKYIDSRYVNYNIFGDNYGMKYYAIPSVINTLYPISIHISEGIFDMISIFNITPDNEKQNSIFASVNGKTYMALIKHIMLSYGIMNFDLHIYPDADISNNEMYNIKRNLDIFNIRIFIHRNTYEGEKDFGVSPDRIINSCVKI